MSSIGYPAPIGGWNARDPLDSMEPTDAVDLLNWFPQAGAVYGRGGSFTKLTVAANHPVDSLIPFTSATASNLLAACNGAIYDITNLSTATSLASGYTSNRWQFGHFNNKAILVNGSDSPVSYNGATISTMVIAPFGVPVISSVTQANIGGSLLDNTTYTYRITATLNGAETLASVEVGVTTSGTGGNQHTCAINWSQLSGVDGYNIYGRTAGGELKIASVGLVSTYTDFGSITPSGALPAVDNIAKNFSGVVNFKGRAVYWGNVPGFWYAPAGAFQGTLSYFPLDLVFHEGGYVVMCLSWSRDSGDGVDDIFAAISSNGECLIYQGADPSNILTWSLTGRFKTGVPLSVRAHGKLASSEIVVTSDGFSGMDELIANQRSQDLQTFGGKILKAASDAVKSYKNNFGWECCYYPRGQMFLVNVPIASDQFQQYVRNTNTGAWCRFTGWNARTLCVFGERLYFGTNDGRVILADTDLSDSVSFPFGDDGSTVERNAQCAYVRLTQPGMKTNITGVQIISNMASPTKASIHVLSDYQTRSLRPTTDAPDLVSTNIGTWDVSDWNTDYWADTPQSFNPNAIPALYSVLGYGFANSISFRYKYRNQLLVWYSTNFIFRNAGV